MKIKKLSSRHAIKLEKLYLKVKEKAETFIGYPCNMDFDYSDLYRFLKYPINNVGDPYTSSNYQVNTHEIEREVIKFFANITHAGNDYWGYVTSGGTEGNLYGLYLARELHPNAFFYFSQDTHYSVTKILKMLHVKNIMIRSQKNGEIDYEDLKGSLKIKRDVTPVIMANIGTTMTGAIDDILKIQAIFKELSIKKYYIHCDAALHGMMLPFIKHAPVFDFSSGIDSLSISGHKFIGSPLPCGIVIAKRTNVDRISRAIEYVGTLDTTISGSRNAITPLFLWYAIKLKGLSGFKKMVDHCLNIVQYTLKRFNDIQWIAWKNDFSNIVVFQRPSDKVVEKWQLAVYGNIAHIVIMPHVTKAWIDHFIDDLIKIEFGG
ncbi:MAG: histidine decarboxylase [Deltaproteobacteria bacterium CG07_land_8_20_14_0_80_38_7]|nr:MAG: histidine decarboxylase [Deltaproteobacteria bacterium CG07_land_8_20_14_0_80_38_7]